MSMHNHYYIGPYLKLETETHLGDLFAEKLGDEDIFSHVFFEDSHIHYTALCANQKGQGGVWLDSHGNLGCFVIDGVNKVQPDFGDWLKVTALLDAEGIKYEKQFGYVVEWS